jgi:arylsulfatase A-like enzyme
MAIVWVAIAEYAAPDGRAGRLLALAPPLGAMALAVLGDRLSRVGRWLLPVACTLVLVAGIALPEVVARRRVPVGAAPAADAAPADAPDVVVVVLDTVRADHLGAFGYPKPTSPHFDALAKESTLFMDAVSPGTWSLPSHASLFTGRFVSAHGAHDEHEFLDGDAPTLAETLAGHGWDTRSFTANAWISDSIGMIRGFAWTDEAWRDGDVARTVQGMHRLADRLGFGGVDKGGAGVAATFEQWLAARPPGARPSFVFVNFIEAHFPYHQLPDDYLARFTTQSRRALRGVSSELAVAALGGDLPTNPGVVETATAMYDAAVAYDDALLGRVVDALRRRGTLDRTILVVLSDHGEMLGEHGQFGHGRSPYEPVLHVPLLVRYPPRIPADRRVKTPVSPVGVYATVLDLAGIPPVATTQVGSLVQVIDGGRHPGPVLAEQYRALPGSADASDDPLLEKNVRFRAFRSGPLKLVDAEPGGTFLFDLAHDPGEMHDVAMSRRLEVGGLRDDLAEWVEKLGLPDLAAAATKSVPVDPAVRERQRQLGYAE